MSKRRILQNVIIIMRFQNIREILLLPELTHEKILNRGTRIFKILIFKKLIKLEKIKIVIFNINKKIKLMKATPLKKYYHQSNLKKQLQINIINNIKETVFSVLMKIKVKKQKILIITRFLMYNFKKHFNFKDFNKIKIHSRLLKIMIINKIGFRIDDNN